MSPYLPRSVTLPSTTAPEPQIKASQAGRFGLSKRGIRKDLRRSGPGTQVLVRSIEEELIKWLEEGEVVIQHDSEESTYDFPGRAVGGQEGVREVQRTPNRLVWWIEDDSWARFVVHCCARYYDVVSFSEILIILRYILIPTRASTR